MLSDGAPVSGCGVITRITLHVLGSSPAAITRSTTSLLVKMPAILPVTMPWPDGALAIELDGFSITHTAVVRYSFISRAASRTLVRTPTVTGSVRESRIDARSGMLMRSRSVSTYCIMACCGPAALPPHSLCTPSSAVYSFCEEPCARSSFSSAS